MSKLVWGGRCTSALRVNHDYAAKRQPIFQVDGTLTDARARRRSGSIPAHRYRPHPVKATLRRDDEQQQQLQQLQ